MKNRIFLLVFTCLILCINFSKAQSCYTISGPTGVVTLGNFGVNGAIGDINNDGINDFLVPLEGDYDGNTLTSDEIYVLLGPVEYTSDFNIQNEFDFKITFQQEYNSLNNYQIMDLNDDNINDLFINTNGRGYVFYGPINGAQNNSDIDILFITDASSSLTALGDVTGNGEIDFAVSKNNETTTNEAAGKVRIYEGPFTQASNELLFNNYSSYEGEDAGDYYGLIVSSVPDMNGDGLKELYISSLEYGICTMIDPVTGLCQQFANRDGGDAYIYYSPLLPGEFMANTSNLKFSGITSQSNFVTSFGRSFTYGNDFNGDGNPDLVIGTSSSNRAYVFDGPFDDGVYSAGNASYVQGGPGTLDSSLPIESLGFTVMGVKDTNGDGFDELIVGAPNYGIGSSTSREKGRVYQFNGPIVSGTPSSSAILLNEGNHWDLKLGAGIIKGDLNNDQIEDIVYTTNAYFDFQGALGVCLLDGEVVSVQDIVEPNDIIIYPNPFNSNFKLEINGLQNSASGRIKIYDIMGKLIKEDTLEFSITRKMTLHFDDMDNAPPGIYYISLTLDDGQSITKKTMKY